MILAYDDEQSVYRLGLVLEGQQYVRLFTRWFDDRWSSIPDRYLVYGRKGINQKAIDLIGSELAANGATLARQGSQVR